MTRPILKTVLAALALLATTSLAPAQDVTSTISHFLSPKAPPQAKFIE